MPFSHILGQDSAVATLKAALASGRVHHAYRFEGPDGCGKEMAAFAVAQALVCVGGDPYGCGTCDACRRAITLSEASPHVPLHPDVKLIERGLYAPDIIGRDSPEKVDISINQIRTIVLGHAAYPPHEGRARVFIFRRAEEMNQNAANSLLKTLEEPYRGTHFILLTSRGDRLLNTIRSRTLPIRFGPLPDAVVRGILGARGVPDDRQELAIDLAAGSASAALELCDDEQSAARDAFVQKVMAAVEARDLGPAVALSEGGEKDKAALRDELRALGAVLARKARQEVGRSPGASLQAAKRYDAVARAVVSLERNASPQLAMLTLIQELRAAPKH